MNEHPLNIRRPEWMARAACRGMNPDFFFPGQGHDITGPKAVCQGCPVREECLEYAIEIRELDGIWGGMSGKARRKTIARQNPTGIQRRVDTCRNGHPYDDRNTYIDYAGHRRCRTCRREHAAAHARAAGVRERGIPADGQELADVVDIRRGAR